MLQFSGDSAFKYIGSSKGKSGDNEFYNMTISDSEGNVIRLYTDAVTFGKAGTLSFGEEITPVIRIYQNRSGGVGCTLTDFIRPSRG